MGISERRKRDREAMRAKILDAARELLVEEGYQAVTVRRIADEIEYSTMAIYVHFKDKHALISELVSEDFRKFARHFQRLARVKDPLRRLEKLGAAYVSFALEMPNHYRLMFMSARPPGDTDTSDLTDPRSSAYIFLRMTIEECLAQGRLRPGLDDPELIAQGLWSAVHGLVSLHISLGQVRKIPWRPLRARASWVIGALVRDLSGAVSD